MCGWLSVRSHVSVKVLQSELLQMCEEIIEVLGKRDEDTVKTAYTGHLGASNYTCKQVQWLHYPIVPK